MDTTPEVVSPKVGPVYTCYQCDLKFNNKPQHDNHLHEVHQKRKLTQVAVPTLRLETLWVW